MQYILGAGDKDKRGCIFCARLKRRRDRENLILWRGKSAAVFMNKFPYNNGHLMVLPNRHKAQISELNRDEILEIQGLIALALAGIKAAMNPDGFNIGLNLGKTAGAGVLDHIHWHIVPRWSGDTNFMPVIAETKVMPEHLQSVYRRLRKALQQESGR